MKAADHARSILCGTQKPATIADHTLLYLKKEAAKCDDVDQFVCRIIPDFIRNPNMSGLFLSIFGKTIGNDFCKMFAFLGKDGAV